MVENKKQARVEQILLNGYFFICCLFFVIPMLLVITSSFTNDNEIRLYGYSLLPREWSLESYRAIFRIPQRMFDAYIITAFTSIVGTIMSVTVMALVAYPLSRRDFAYRKAITFFIFFTLLFSGGLIPSYIMNTQILKLDDTIWIYLLLHLANAWHIIIIRTFFQQLPYELIESAKMDGAKELRIFFAIIVPLSKPVLATIALFVLLGRWNEWMITLVYIRSERLYTLQFILQRLLLQAEFARSYMLNVPGIMIDSRALPTLSMRYAMTVIAAGPMLLVFPFFQKYFTRGLTIGAIKG
ncbi:MAG: carbohydrate ABC transporter permease [Defluviitaleaceae bacterium]|nr:carbohydrate ABC transporter permease [Defluviitaleaceae bacterium]MCL2836237.1 carbohydrate ABC transporter permease [Defluviitaleaceae bacterium]